MPYIKEEKRNVLDPAIDNIHDVLVKLELDDDRNSMEANINYTITKLLRTCYGESYNEINDAIGVLSCVMLEHYRTIAAPYEEQKRYENGDIQPSNKKESLSEVVVEKKGNN